MRDEPAAIREWISLIRRDIAEVSEIIWRARDELPSEDISDLEILGTSISRLGYWAIEELYRRLDSIAGSAGGPVPGEVGARPNRPGRKPRARPVDEG